MKKGLGIIMTIALLMVMLVLVPVQAVAAKGKIKISTTKKTITVGNSCKVTLNNAGNVKWKSSKKSVATVKRIGKNKAVVKTKIPGKTTIIATYKGKKYKCQITVKSKKREEAEYPKLNATDVKLYCISSDYADFIQWGTSHLQSFQFKVVDTKQEVRRWELIGEESDYFNISDYGKVSVNWNVPYNTIVKATVRAYLENGSTLDATVSMESEINTVVNQKFKDFKDTYITDTMSKKEIVEKICWYVGTFSDYELYNDSWLDLLLKGKGDCMASRVLVVHMCNYMGIKAAACSIAYHGQTIVKIDDIYYMTVTGFDEPKPRSYLMYEIQTDDIKGFCKERGVYWAQLQ